MAKKRKASRKAQGPSAPAPATASGAAAPEAATVTPAAPSRGRLRREVQRKQRDVQAAPLPIAPAEEPAFFFGFEISWAKLVLARVIVFSLLAFDALEQISHAPRYGAGGFNVAHLAVFEPIAVGRELYDVGQLLSAYALVLAACGVATRIVLPLATVLYGWLYFSSQLDSYQHHYLVFLLLLLSCFVPWRRPVDATPQTRVRSWAVRLMLLQLAIVYFYAAVSKMNGAWLDGRTLGSQLQGSMRDLINTTVGMKAAAWSVLLVELVLATTVWTRRAWVIAAPLGIALHLGIMQSNLEIGLFAWLMLGLYILVVPDRVWIWLAGRPPMTALRWFAHALRQIFSGSLRFIVWVVALAGGTILAMVSRFDHGPAVGLWLVLALIAGTLIALRGRASNVAWIATAHLLAFVMWTAVDRGTSTATDYYRKWGGSSRRLGDAKTAEHAYRQMTEVAPNEGAGFFQLGRLLLARDASEEGLAALRRAQDLEPLKARAYVAEARWLATHGKREEAIAKAREATIVEPTDAEAKTLLDSLQGSR
jgi:hypothetical protein